MEVSKERKKPAIKIETSSSDDWDVPDERDSQRSIDEHFDDQTAENTRETPLKKNLVSGLKSCIRVNDF